MLCMTPASANALLPNSGLSSGTHFRGKHGASRPCHPTEVERQELAAWGQLGAGLTTAKEQSELETCVLTLGAQCACSQKHR